MALSLRDEMIEVGFNPPDNINAGQTLRFSTNDKRSDLSGWVHLFADGQGATFGCWRTGEQHTWQAARDKPFNAAEQAEFKRKVIACKQSSLAEKKAGYQQAAAAALTEWESSKPATEEHPYLIRKGIGQNMARIDTRGNLLIPVYGTTDELQSLQRISPDGGKRFFKGGKVRGGHVWLGSPANGATLLLCEGFATGDTLHRATGHAICICFSAGNLRSVAEALRKRYTKAGLIIAGDDDIKADCNTGRAKALEAAQAVAGTAVFPTGGGDFNDLEKSEGLGAVRGYFEQMQLPALNTAFDTPALSGTNSRDGTINTRPLSELGNAARLMDAHSSNIHYAHDAKAWLHWRGGAWVWDVDGAMVRGLAAKLPAQIYNEGGWHLADAEYFAKWSRTSQKET
ncbi:MAG: toprim domain-containing protein, partial [Methylococcaceae bacterium]